MFKSKSKIVMVLGLILISLVGGYLTLQRKKTEKANVSKLVESLNKAFADEWLAYYQYWIGAQIVSGPMQSEVIAELKEHAIDELRHADMLAKRIIQLNGIPILEPKQWYEASNCGFLVPTDPNIKKILQQNVKGEQCAISAYKKLLETTKDTDTTTYQMIHEILANEIEHEKDLLNLLKVL